MGPVELCNAPVAPPVQERVLRKPAVPAKPVEARGLCRTCRHATACGFRQTDGQVKVYCEEYEAAPTPVALALTVETEQTERPAGKLLGLCMNCDHRHTCALPKPECGVWHCNEYQ